MHRNEDIKRGPRAPVADSDRPSVDLFYDAPYHVKADAGPLPLLLGCKVGIENLVENV